MSELSSTLFWRFYDSHWPTPLWCPIEAVEEKVVRGRFALVDLHVDGNDEDYRVVTLCVNPGCKVP